MAGGRRAWILGGAVALAFAAVTAVFVRPDRFDQVSREWMESRALGIARVLAGASQAAVDFEDPVAAARAIASVRATPGVAYAALSVHGGRVLARWGEVPEATARQGPAVEWGVGLLHVRVEVIGRAGSRGRLSMGFFLDELDGRVRQTRVLLLWLSVATLGLGAAITRVIGLARRVQERTGELARTHDALAKLRRAQEQLVVADRRVSLGRLAAGVGHEINNPLSFVTANVTAVRTDLADLRARLAAAGPDPAAVRRVLGDAEEALADAAHGAERIRRIVRQLKTFSRNGDDEALVPVRLRDALDTALEMALHEVKHRARLEREERAVPVVRANPVRLAQVFVNLLVNAAQAIPEGDAERQLVRVVVGIDAADQAYVAVSDTGTGIAPEVLPRLFEPFFTTKPAGAGTGLGLSISRGIVRELGGDIRVESRPGEGSTFTVVLPHERAEVSAEEPPPSPTPPPRCEHLLVVDDEPLVATSLARVLSRWHRVEVATSGRDAIAMVAAGHRYDHILCDLAMPDAGGMDVHGELARIAPEQARRIVLMTGGAFTDRTRTFLESWPGPWIEKPIDFEKLRRILDEP